MKYLKTLSFIMIILIIAGCGSSKKAVQSAPDWYLNVPEDPNFMFAAVTSTSRDMQVAVNKAQADARNEIAQQLEMRMSGLTRRFQEEVGLDENSELLQQFTLVYKAVVDQVLIGTRPSKREILTEGNIYRAFVLMEMPIGQANTALVERMRQREAMYTRFRATQAFEDLEKEIKEYEEWRARQQMQ